MIIDYDDSGAKLLFFKELYEEAKSHAERQYADMDKWYAQYKGSREIDGSDTEAKHIRNITYELVESQVTNYIPNPSVSPKMQSERNERNAKSIEMLLRAKRDELPFEKLNDMDERYNPIYGGSVWLVEWDDSIMTHNTVGDVKISCLSPRRFLGQPHIYDLADMEYCFICFETTKEDIVRRYGVTMEVAENTDSEKNDGDDTATIFVCYYKNEDDKVCQFAWSDETVLLDIEDYYQRKRKICTKCGKREELCECEKPKFVLQNEEFEEITRDIHRTDGSVIPAMSEVIRDGRVVMETKKQQVMDERGGAVAFEDVDHIIKPLMQDIQVPKTEPTKLPFYAPSVLPVVIRKNTSEEDNLFGQSDCFFIRPQQMAINKIESRIMEKVMRSGVYPVVPEDFTGSLDNSLYERPLRANPGNYQLFGRVDLQVDISRDIAEAERQYDQAKRILGITDSFQGQYDGSAQSGKAKQLQIQQAAGRLDSKRQMKNAAYAEIDHIIFQYYLAYADEPRPATYRDANGNLQNYIFNRYDFIERDEAGEYYYNDQFMFRTDATIDVEQSRELLWQENRQNFQQGAYGDPTLPQSQLIFWQNMEKAHYPWANDNVERIKAEIERQREVQMLQQQNEQLQGDLGKREQYEQYLLGKIGEMRGGAQNVAAKQ